LRDLDLRTDTLPTVLQAAQLFVFPFRYTVKPKSWAIL